LGFTEDNYFIWRSNPEGDRNVNVRHGNCSISTATRCHTASFSPKWVSLGSEEESVKQSQQFRKYLTPSGNSQA
jgi:hypothetical protein